MKSEGYQTNLQLTQGEHWWHWGRNRIVDTALSKQIKGADLKILDFGAGLGGMVPLLSQYGEVTAVEPSPQARSMAQEAGRKVIDPRDLPSEATFGLVTAFDVLEHVQDELPWLEELDHRLTDDGYLMLTVPAFSWLWTLNDVVAEHKRRYTKKSLTAVLGRAGFETFYLTYWNSLLLPGVALFALRDHFRLKRVEAGKNLEFTYLNTPPKPINAILKTLLRMDSYWIKKGRTLPFGVSLLVVAKKKTSSLGH